MLPCTSSFLFQALATNHMTQYALSTLRLFWEVFFISDSTPFSYSVKQHSYVLAQCAHKQSNIYKLCVECKNTINCSTGNMFVWT